MTYRFVIPGNPIAQGRPKFDWGRGKKKVSDKKLLESYKRTQSIWETAKEFFMCGQSVHERLKRLNAIINNKWSKEEDNLLIKLYNSYSSATFSLEMLAKQMNRTKQSIAIRATKLGITERSRPKSLSHRDALSKMRKELCKTPGYIHPKPSLGKKLTQETKEKLSKASTLFWNSLTKKRRTEITKKILQTKIKNKTTSHTINTYSNRKSGKRKDLNNLFVRSSWEANYARYLNYLKNTGKIIRWEYEKDRFWFKEIKNGIVSYCPDFKIEIAPDIFEYHEVKGWMTENGKIALQRMERYYPEIKILVIDKLKYKTIAKFSMNIAKINNWEL